MQSSCCTSAGRVARTGVRRGPRACARRQDELVRRVLRSGRSRPADVRGVRAEHGNGQLGAERYGLRPGVRTSRRDRRECRRLAHPLQSRLTRCARFLPAQVNSVQLNNTYIQHLLLKNLK